MGFRDEVETAAWLAEVVAWVGEKLAPRGWEVTGEPDQRRVRPWSSQVVVPTTPRSPDSYLISSTSPWVSTPSGDGC